MGANELKEKTLELEKELMKLRAQVASGTPPENPGRMGEIKKTLARIITIKNEKEVSKKKDE